MKYSPASCFSALVLLLPISLLPPSTAQATSQNTYMGTIFYTAANFCPKFSLPPNGQVLDIVQFRPLYSLIGNTYGGNGITQFALPDLRGRAIVGASRMGTPNGLPPKPFGYKGGQTSIQLETKNLPAHRHNATLKNQNEAFRTEFYVSTETGSEPASTPDTWLARKKQGFSNLDSYIPANEAGKTAKVSTTHNPSPTLGEVSLQPAGKDLPLPLSINTSNIVLQSCMVVTGPDYPTRPNEN